MLCFVRCVPWQSKIISIKEGFIALSITYRKKKSSSSSSFYRNEVTRPIRNCSDTDSLLSVVSEEIGGEVLESIDDIFKIEQNGQRPRRILISGEPGVGKSTLLLKIAYDWFEKNKTKQTLKDPNLLFHLSLSGVTADAELGEEIAKQILPVNAKLTASLIEEYIRQHEGDVILLLDSFDESVFASLKSAPAKCGGIYDAIAFKRFRGCIVVVTMRSWKDNDFGENLFNKYAEIVVNGFVSDSVEQIICRHSNATHENNVKKVLNTNLLNLRPMFRNPLFVITICELVANNVTIDNYSLTVTKLLQQLCEYLFKFYNAKASAARVDEIRETDVDRYLVGIGEIASNNNFHYINGANENLSSEQKELLQVGLSIGFILTSNRDERLLYFCHGLLRDFCLAKYYHNLLKEHNTSGFHSHNETITLYENILVKSLPWNKDARLRLRGLTLKKETKEGMMYNDISDNHDASFLNYFTVFMCAFDDVVLRALDLITFAVGGPGPLDLFEKNCRYSLLSFLSQCMYESKFSDLKTYTPTFLQHRCIVFDMSIINSHAATEYILSVVSREESLVPKEFVVIGDTFTSKNQVSTTDRGSSSSNDDVTIPFRIDLENKVLSDLLSKCRLITSLKLMHLKMTCHTGKLDSIKKLRKLESILIHNVGGIASAKYLLNFVSCNLEHVQELYLIDLRVSMYMEQSSDLRFQDIFFLLCDVADIARNMILPSVHDINELVVSPERIDSMTLLHLHELYLGECDHHINYQQLLAKLVYCPKLEKIALIACWIDFNIDPKCKVIGSIRRSIAKFLLEINMCKNEIIFANVVFISSMFYQEIKELTLVLLRSDVKFADFHPSITITAKCQTLLLHCTCTVIGSEKSPFKEKLGGVTFFKCTLNKNKSHNISEFIQWFSHFFIFHGGVCMVWLRQDKRKYGDQNRLIYTLRVNIMDYTRAVDIHDVITSVQAWIPISSLTELYVHTEPVPSPKEDKWSHIRNILPIIYSHMNEMRFGESYEDINCQQLLTKLVSCPHLATIAFDNCNIDFGVDTSLFTYPDTTGCSARELQIAIDNCKNEILFSNLLSILTTFSHEITSFYLQLQHSEIGFSNFRSTIPLRGKYHVFVDSCLCKVFDSYVYSYKKKLESITFFESTLTETSSISGVLQCCEQLCFRIKNDIHMSLCHEERSKGDMTELKFSPIIQCIDLNTVDIHDVTSFLQKWNHWIPISSVKKLVFNTVLDLPLDDGKLAAVKACAMNVYTVEFVKCKNALDMFQHLKALRTCFTSLCKFMIHKCNLSFAHSKVERRTHSEGLPLVESMTETQSKKIDIHIQECKHVKISDILLLGLYANVNTVTIAKCDVTIDFTRNIDIAATFDAIECLIFKDCNLPADISHGRIKTMRYSNLHEFHLAESEKRIHCEQLLTKLVSCPKLATIILTECHIDFILTTSELRDDESTGSSGRKLLIEIDKCKNEIIFANLLSILSTFSQEITSFDLKLKHSGLVFSHFHSIVPLRSQIQCISVWLLVQSVSF